jgi:NAD(P)-dependent dehydrogenase (short-subunit alcohol dehydrogenase family)
LFYTLWQWTLREPAMRNIFIVGSTHGIGQTLSERLRADGASLWTASRGAAAGEHHLEWDAAGDPLPDGFLPERLDGLVYCPGSINLKPFNRLTEKDLRADLEVNLLGAVRAIQAALPALKASGNASLVLFSTVAATTGMPMHASIAAAKGAVEGLTRSLAAELAPGIRVNAIAPSLTDTPLAAGLLRTERQREAAADRHPLQRIGQAEELAGLARFLLSDEAGWITGQVVHADGGMGAVRRFA